MQQYNLTLDICQIYSNYATAIHSRINITFQTSTHIWGWKWKGDLALGLSFKYWEVGDPGTRCHASKVSLAIWEPAHRCAGENHSLISHYLLLLITVSLTMHDQEKQALISSAETTDVHCWLCLYSLILPVTHLSVSLWSFEMQSVVTLKATFYCHVKLDFRLFVIFTVYDYIM